MIWLAALNSKSMERPKLLAINLIVAGILSILLKRPIDLHGANQFHFGIDSSHLISFANPSAYASGAYSLIFPLLGSLLFPVSYIISLIIGWLQIAEGMHSWMDIGESIAIAGFGYAVAEAFVFRQRNIVNRKDERARKATHILSNISACILIWWLGAQTISFYVLMSLCIGIPLMHIMIVGIRIPGLEQWIKNVGREGEIPGEGAMYNALGILFALGLLRSDCIAAIATIMILALGDGLATWVGTIYGKHKLPWNSRKTFEGSIGFVVGAMCALLVLPLPITVVVVIIAAVVETLPIRLNDNLTLPFISSSIYYFAL